MTHDMDIFVRLIMIVALAALMWIILKFAVKFIKGSLKGSRDDGILYLDYADDPPNIYLQLYIDIPEVEVRDYVNLKIDKINSNRKKNNDLNEKP